jgi:hypothetical protein
MHFYKLDYALEKFFTTEPREERQLLKKYTGKQVSEDEASWLWDRIADHKWHLSERLNRDVGFHVAAVDYVENFYEPAAVKGVRDYVMELWEDFSKVVVKALKNYFEAKGRTISL